MAGAGPHLRPGLVAIPTGQAPELNAKGLAGAIARPSSHESTQGASMAENPAVTGIGTSIVRTAVPFIVGLIVTSLAKANVDIDPGILDDAIAGVVTTVYYAAVRLAETHIAPWYGWLLGVAKRPVYEAPAQ